MSWRLTVLLMLVLVSTASAAVEDLSTYDETDGAGDYLAIGQSGNVRWTMDQGAIDSAGLRISKNFGTGAFDTGWTATFTINPTTLVSGQRVCVLGLANTDASIRAIVTADGDAVYVYLQTSNSDGQPYLTLAVLHDGEIVDYASSSSFSIWHTAAVELVRSGNNYTISAIANSTQLFAGDNTVTDSDGTLWAWCLPFSEVTAVTASENTLWGQNYELTGLAEPNPKATSPNPADTLTDVDRDSNLSWSAGTGATSRNVYFGTDSEDLDAVATGIETTSHALDRLEYSTTYYWRIDEIAGETTTTGDVWSFTVEDPPQTTFYVGPSATGDEDGTSRDDLMALSAFIAAAEPGHTAVLQPGDYGEVLIDDGYGVEGEIVTYIADTTTCTARASTWWAGDIDAPSTSVAPVFRKLWIASYGSSGTPTGHYLRFEGISIVCTSALQPLYLYQLVAHVDIVDCSLWGVTPADATYHETGDRSVGIELYPGAGSRHEDILFDGMYVETVRQGVKINVAGGTDNIIFRDCHFKDMCMAATETYNGVTFDHCHIQNEAPKADSTNIMAEDVVVASVGSPDTTVFTHAGAHVDNVQWCRVEGGTDNEIRKVLSYPGGSSTITLEAALSFSVVPGTHTLTLYNQSHGSAVSIWSSNVTVQNCLIHDISGTASIYSYTAGIDDLTIENNLVYDCANPEHVFDFAANPVGDRIIIRHNTVVSSRHANFGTEGWEAYRYGTAFTASMQEGADGATWKITNNIFVGRAATPPAGATVRGNIVYAGTNYEADSEGVNQGNVVLYLIDADAFDEAGGYFVGGDDWETAFTSSWHHRDYNAAFKLAAGSPAINAGSSVSGDFTTTDFEGETRGSNPDVGFDEYAGAFRRGFNVFGGIIQ